MKVLLTDASGMLGSCLAARLLESGFSVRALLDPADDAPSLGGLAVERAPGRVLDPESVQAALEGAQAVFHCASAGRYWPLRPDALHAGNVEGTRNLLVAMSRAGIDKLVHLGSAFSFGAGTLEEPGTEETPYDGERFGLACLDSTHAAQELVLRYGESGKLRCVVINPTLVIGAGAGPAEPLTALLRYASSGHKVFPPGGVNAVAVADVAAVALKALGRGLPGHCYIVGGENVSYRELLAKLATALGVPAPSRAAGVRGLLARGLAGSIRGRLTGAVPTMTSGLARLAAATLYYSGEKAASQLEYSPGPLDPAIESACRGFERR